MAKQNYDLDALFHPNVDIGDQTPRNAVEYSPTADKGQAGVYKSAIRFVAWWQDPQHSISEKWVSWLVDPVTNRGRFIDCPSSVGKPSPLQEMFFKLYKSESAQERELSKVFSRKHSFAAIVQIIKDVQAPELEGKLMVWKFGKKVFEKIEAEKKPVMGEPHEPFDLIEGKAFSLVITKVSGFNNYDQSKFLDKRIPLLIPDANGKLFPINTKTPRETVFNFLKENSPDLSKYAYKEWDQETYDYVNQVITQVTGQKVSSTVYADVKNSKSTAGVSGKPTTKQPVKPSGITASEITDDDFESDGGAYGAVPDLTDLPDVDDSFNFGSDLGDLGDALKSL